MPSVTFMYCVERSKCILKLFHHLVDTPFKFLHTKRYNNSWTGTPVTGASNARCVCSSQN